VTQPATNLSVRWGSHRRETWVSRHVAAVTRGGVVVAELCSSHSSAPVSSAHLRVTAIASARYDGLFAPFQDWAMVGAVVADSCGTATLSKDGAQP
jgi:hypothetical protein